MTHIHYKFSSKLSADTVIFDGLNITLRELKRQIMDREKLRSGDCDLLITNAQTKEGNKTYVWADMSVLVLTELWKKTRGPGLTAARWEGCVTSFSLTGLQKSQALTKRSNEWTAFLLHLRSTPIIKGPDCGGSARSEACVFKSLCEMWDKNSAGSVGAQPSHDHKIRYRERERNQRHGNNE